MNDVSKIFQYFLKLTWIHGLSLIPHFISTIDANSKAWAHKNGHHTKNYNRNKKKVVVVHFLLIVLIFTLQLWNTVFIRYYLETNWILVCCVQYFFSGVVYLRYVIRKNLWETSHGRTYAVVHCVKFKKIKYALC
jgi:uncharacterized membrane protein